MYAVIRMQGHQYKVEEGQEFLVPLLGETKPEAEVLMVVDEKGVKIGTPTVTGAKVELKVIEDTKGEKIYVAKYKAKSRYRKRTGFRAKLTKLQVVAIK